MTETKSSRLLVGLVIAIGIALFAISGTVKTSAPASQNPGAAPAAGVPWQDYSPAVRTRIDGLAAARDCAGLQGEFDTADATNQATMARTGHNNADLMDYIDDKLRGAGCY